MAADFDNENPYDNMSQHTTETTTKDGDDIISVKSAAGTKSPMPGKLDLICRLQLPKIRNFNCALKSKILWNCTNRIEEEKLLDRIYYGNYWASENFLYLQFSWN